MAKPSEIMRYPRKQMAGRLRSECTNMHLGERSEMEGASAMRLLRCMASKSPAFCSTSAIGTIHSLNSSCSSRYRQGYLIVFVRGLFRPALVASRTFSHRKRAGPRDTYSWRRSQFLTRDGCDDARIFGEAALLARMTFTSTAVALATEPRLLDV